MTAWHSDKTIGRFMRGRVGTGIIFPVLFFKKLFLDVLGKKNLQTIFKFPRVFMIPLRRESRVNSAEPMKNAKLLLPSSLESKCNRDITIWQRYRPVLATFQ